MSDACAVCGSTGVYVRYRLVPRRDVEPLGDDIRRARSWPGGVAVAFSCQNPAHQRQVKAQGTTVLEETPLSAGVTRRAVKDEDSAP